MEIGGGVGLGEHLAGAGLHFLESLFKETLHFGSDGTYYAPDFTFDVFVDFT